MDQRLIDLYHDYAHVHFDRRVFLEKAARIVGSVSAAAALLPLLAPDDAKAAMVAPDDQRVTTSRVTFKGVTGDVKAYLAKPTASGRHGAVEVIHAVGGISPHIEDVCRRLAVDGFIALGVDFLSPLGGTPVPRNPEVASADALAETGRDRQATRSPARTICARSPSRTARSVRSGSAGAEAWSTGSPSPIRCSISACRSTAHRRRPRTCPRSRPRC